MSHFVDETGNIPKHIPKEARELASFLALVIDAVTKVDSGTYEVRCFIDKCDGKIESHFSPDRETILWKCLKCDNGGEISGWKGTKWDNSK